MPVDRAAIRAHIASLLPGPLISVVMPAYQTPEAQLRAAIASVQAQLWPHWELCIADDASPLPHVAHVLAELAAADPRIRWMRRDQNGHISAASNSALALARGEWVALMDHDDIMPEQALYEVVAEIAAHPEASVIYSDEDKIDGEGRRFSPFFKPDFDPDLLLGQNFISHLGCYRRDLMLAIGGFREGFEGSQDHDLALRATERVGQARVRHIPAVLYHWRQMDAATSFSETQLARCIDASRRAVAEILAARGVSARLEPAPLAPGFTRVVWPLPDLPPLVSVIVPMRDRLRQLEACVQNVLRRTDYPALEFLVVDNEGRMSKTLAVYDRLQSDPRVRILAVPGQRSDAALINHASAEARGDILLLLGDDVEVLHGSWLREMVSQALRPDVGAVGAKLLTATGLLCHGGLVIGAATVAEPYLPHLEQTDWGNYGSLALVREVSAISATCLVMRSAVFAEVGGLDAAQFTTALGDVDLCLRIRKAGYRIIWTPFAELRIRDSASREPKASTTRAGHLITEIAIMRHRWGEVLRRDPFHNSNYDATRTTRLHAHPLRDKPWTHYRTSHGRLVRPTC